MLSVALTGNIAAGKTTVATWFRRWGATVIDADQLVREIQSPGTPEYDEMVARFGSGILHPDGNLNRAALRTLVLANPVSRQALEAIIHPAVEQRRLALEAGARTDGARIVVSDIPLLFETQDPGRFDRVVLVDAPEPVRLARLQRERGLSREDATGLIAAQWPAERKRAWRDPEGRGPMVIENDGDQITLERRARTVWQALLDSAPSVV
jgi:dephospho-CoA kinase